ncbi:hypothetical protein U1Q18_003390 [Sarracenia purpurea var. burkii]
MKNSKQRGNLDLQRVSSNRVDAYPPGNRFLALSNLMTEEDEVSRVPGVVAELVFGEQALKSVTPTSALTVPSVLNTEYTEVS